MLTASLQVMISDANLTIENPLRTETRQLPRQLDLGVATQFLKQATSGLNTASNSALAG